VITPQKWLLIPFLCIPAGFLPAQAPVETHACTTTNDHQFQCDKSSFGQVLNAVRSLSVEAPRLHPASLNQMQELARSLGKTVRADSSLRLVLAPSDPGGVYYGPSDRELGTIRAWYGKKLLWVESFSGQPDTPWPIVVNHLTAQFRHNFRK
jgi:hypothetical protein